MPCRHSATKLQVGPYPIWAAGGDSLRSRDVDPFDVLVTMAGYLPLDAYSPGPKTLLWCPIPDFSGPSENWRQYLETEVIPTLKAGKKMIVFCLAGHGRTGLMLASLIALLEDRAATPDPVQVVRERYCRGAVETLDQVAAVFALRGEGIPLQYQTRRGAS